MTDPSASASAATAVGTSVHRHSSRKEMEVADYESSDEDRHFKRKKPSRYERSPPVVVSDVSEDKHRYSKRGKGERSRAWFGFFCFFFCIMKNRWWESSCFTVTNKSERALLSSNAFLIFVVEFDFVTTLFLIYETSEFTVRNFTTIHI